MKKGENMKWNTRFRKEKFKIWLEQVLQIKHENVIVQEMEQGKDGRKLWENINKLKYGTIKGKNQECKLYDDTGNNLTEQNGSIINYWRRIYPKHDNQISLEWNENERLRYREMYGDENLVQRGRYDEDWYAEQFVNTE